MRLLANNEVQEEAKAAFLQADGDQPCQFIKIAGPTRSGKSTFANALLGTTAFQTSDSAEPCTQGIDFCGLRPLAPLARRLGIEGPTSGLLSILDIEGGGDRSLQYDVQNLMPAFMLPGVVIWNVLGHPPRSALLDQLAVISRIGGQLVDRAAGGATFPNALIVVIRDYSLTSSADQILRRLLEVEPETNGDGTTNAESAARNGIRQVLQAAFTSVEVTVLPVRGDAEYRAAERGLMHTVLTLATRNDTRLTPPMCLDLMCDLTRQIGAHPQAVNVGSTLAYINLCEYTRRLRAAEEQIAALFGEWYAASQYITSVPEAEAKFEKLAEHCWRTNMLTSFPIPAGEGLGDTAEERRTRFLDTQRRALLQPCVAELKLLEAERTITQMELTAAGLRGNGERLRRADKGVVDRAATIRRELIEHGAQPRYVLAALGNPSSFEDFYHESGLEVLVASYTRNLLGTEADGVAISDVLAVDEVLQPILDSRLGDVFTVDNIVLNLL